MALGRIGRRRPGVRDRIAAAAVIAVALAPVAACSGPAQPGANAPRTASVAVRSRSWGKVTAIPGLGQLNSGGDADVDSVSCTSPGNCAAEGSYEDAQDAFHRFVASERNGRWQAASQLPGTAGLAASGSVSGDSVWCRSAGTCLAGGGYQGNEKPQAFLASERNGRWHAAIAVPGVVGPNPAGHATVNGHAAVYPVSPGLVSCASPGNCAVGGAASGSAGSQAVVASVQGGRWQPAVDVLSSAGLNTGNNAWVTALSCASPGNCAAGGSYKDAQGHIGLFVVSQRDARWQPAIEIPGTASLNAGGLPQIDSLSCPRAGNCAAGGWYLDSSGNRHAFVASEQNGQWHGAIEVPGALAHAAVNAVSCGSPGNCAAGGSYTDRAGHFQGFVASEQNGRWYGAVEVPGPQLNVGEEGGGGHAQVDSVSCAAAGYCVASGSYTDYDGHRQGFVVAHQ